MNTTINITPEWVLSEMKFEDYANGDGYIDLETFDLTDLRWIRLALKTLNIPYEDYDYFGDDDYYMGVRFKIDDLKAECPSLHARFKELDEEAKIDRTVETAFERFLSAMAGKVTPKTYQAYRNLMYYMEKFCESEGRPLWWYSLSSEREAEWRDYLAQSTLSEKSIRHYIKAKKDFMLWCWENHITDKWGYLEP
jgi:hypothetical protein